jgi:hypothetical protein
MRLALKSTDPVLEIRNSARHIYRCSGGAVVKKHTFSPRCETHIKMGQQYIAAVEWQATTGRAVPRHKVDTHRICVHCALAFCPGIKIAGEAAA